MSNHQVVSLNRGRTFVRSVITRAIAGADDDTASAFAHGRWGAAGERVKAAVSAVVTGDVSPEAREFFSLVAEQSVLGRIGARRVPFNIRLVSVVGGATGYWVGQSNPKPLSKPALAGSTLDALKVSAIIATTAEALRDGGEFTEAGLHRDLERAVVGALDLAFLDVNNAGVAGEVPASITYGAPSAASTGSAAQDFDTLLELFGGDLGSAVLVTDARTALGLARGNGAAGLDLGARGGSLHGIPVVVSRSSPVDSSGGQIVVVDGQGIAVAYDQGRIDVAKHSTLIMSDDPLNDPGAPVSLWQTNTMALRSEQPANWERQRAGSVAVITGATY